MSVQYALSGSSIPPRPDRPRVNEEWVAWEEAAKAAGHLVDGAGLTPSSEAKSVSVRNGEPGVREGGPDGEASSFPGGPLCSGRSAVWVIGALRRLEAGSPDALADLLVAIRRVGSRVSRHSGPTPARTRGGVRRSLQA